MTVGNSIKTCRKAAGLTQAELGEKLGVGQYIIAKWETGVNNPAPDDLTKIAKILGVSVAALFGEQAPTGNTTQPPPPEARTRAAQMQKVFEKLKPADQRALLKHAKGLIQ